MANQDFRFCKVKFYGAFFIEQMQWERRIWILEQQCHLCCFNKVTIWPGLLPSGVVGKTIDRWNNYRQCHHHSIYCFPNSKIAIKQWMAGIIEPLEPSLKFHYCIQLKNGHFFGEKMVNKASGPLVKSLVSELVKGPWVRMYYPKSWLGLGEMVENGFVLIFLFFRRPPVCRVWLDNSKFWFNIRS